MTGWYSTSTEKRFCPVCNTELTKYQRVACCKKHSALLTAQNPARNEKVRQAKLGSPRPDMRGDLNPMHKPDVKEKVSLAQKGVPRPWQQGDRNPSKRPEVREKISAALQGKPHPWMEGDRNPMRNPDTATRWSDHLKSLGDAHPSKRPEVQEKIRQSRLGTTASPETRMKHRDRMLNLGEDHWMKEPERREQMKENNPMKVIVADPVKYEEWFKSQNFGMGSDICKRKLIDNNPMKDITNRNKISEKLRGKPHPWLQGDKHPNWKGGITAERQAFYESEEWKYVAPLVWWRDRATCQKCGKIYSRKTYRFIMDIHHIIPFEYKEYRAILWNLILLCRTCHKFVHSKKNTNQEFQMDQYSYSIL